MQIQIPIHIHIHIPLQIYIHIHVRIHIHIYIYMYIYKYIHIYIHTYIHIHVHTHIHVHPHIHMQNQYTCAYMSYVPMCKHDISIYICIHMYMCAHLCVIPPLRFRGLTVWGPKAVSCSWCCFYMQYCSIALHGCQHANFKREPSFGLNLFVSAQTIIQRAPLYWSFPNSNFQLHSKPQTLQPKTPAR